MRRGFRHRYVSTVSVSIRCLWCFFLSAASIFSAQAAGNFYEDGREYVRLDAVALQFGMQAFGLSNAKYCELRSQWSRLRFGANSRLFHYNEMPVYLGFPVRQKQGVWWLSQSDLHACLQPILTPKIFGQSPRLRTIVLDPGHGGRDQGAANARYGLTEKSLNLQVARGLAKRLNAVGFRVALTRQDDRYLSLEQRTQMANKAQADLFISIHFNAAQSKAASGLETFVLTPQSQPSTKNATLRSSDAAILPGQALNTWNVVLGHALQRELVAATGEEDRGLKRARFSVLRSMQCPAALVELGFLSHDPSASRLRTKAKITVLVDALFAGIVRYQKRLQDI